MNVRVRALDERGDLAAPPGSREWAIAVRGEVRVALQDAESSVRHIQNLLKAMDKHGGYKHLTDAEDRPFETFKAFVVAAPPFGLGYAVEVIDRVLAEERDVPLNVVVGPWGGDRVSKKAREQQEQVDIINLKHKGGTSAVYQRARIQRDCPDIAQRLEAGEFKSVRAAAIEAGIVRPLTPIEQTLKLLTKLTADERQLVRDAIDAMVED